MFGQSVRESEILARSGRAQNRQRQLAVALVAPRLEG